MKDNAREFIIKNLRQALFSTNKAAPKQPAVPADSYFRLEHSDDMVLNFVKQYMINGGVLNYATNNSEVADVLNPWIGQNNIKTVECGTSELSQYLQNLGLETNRFAIIESPDCRFGVVLCESLIAWDGSVVVTSDCFEGKAKIIMPENIVLVAFSSLVVRDFKTYITQKGKDQPMPQQIEVLYPEKMDHKKIQILLIEDQN